MRNRKKDIRGSFHWGSFLFLISLICVFMQCQTGPTDAGESGAKTKGLSDEVPALDPSSNPDTMTKDVLMIVSDTAGNEAKKLVEALPVSQEISSRVRIVRMEEQQAEELRTIGGVYIIEGGALPAELMSSLTGTEKLFAKAWLSNAAQSRKIRPGDGADWDDPNFQPPDSLE